MFQEKCSALVQHLWVGVFIEILSNHLQGRKLLGPKTQVQGLGDVTALNTGTKCAVRWMGKELIDVVTVSRIRGEKTRTDDTLFKQQISLCDLLFGKRVLYILMGHCIV